MSLSHQLWDLMNRKGEATEPQGIFQSCCFGATLMFHKRQLHAVVSPDETESQREMARNLVRYGSFYTPESKKSPEPFLVRFIMSSSMGSTRRPWALLFLPYAMLLLSRDVAVYTYYTYT